MLIALLTVLSYGMWWLWKADKLPLMSHPVTATGEEHMVVPELTQSYRNETYHLAFKYPEGYIVREVVSDTSTTILIENPSDNKGIQIYITPYADKDTTITEERVLNDVPDIDVEDPQPILLGSAGEGLAFKSDNEEFGGDAREAWFVVAGNLYQITTYAAYDEVLKAIFATWSFF